MINYTHITNTIVRASTRPPRTDDNPAKIILKTKQKKKNYSLTKI